MVHILMCVCTYIRMYACTHVILQYVCVAITVKFNQSAYNVTENSGIIQLFLVLNLPSIFNETVQLINTDTDNPANGTYDNSPHNIMLCVNLV